MPSIFVSRRLILGFTPNLVLKLGPSLPGLTRISDTEHRRTGTLGLNFIGALLLEAVTAKPIIVWLFEDRRLPHRFLSGHGLDAVTL